MSWTKHQGIQIREMVLSVFQETSQIAMNKKNEPSMQNIKMNNLIKTKHM